MMMMMMITKYPTGDPWSKSGWCDILRYATATTFLWGY